MKSINIQLVPEKIVLISTPERAEIIRKLEHPQDLNEALFAVRVEQHTDEIVKEINQMIQRDIMKVLV